MVMPCYNKAPYIGKMFDSILAQKYDNIELVLVNDGSTDGTRDIIWDYSDKFRDRGFEVTIIEQANKGLCGAVKAGISHITGDFVCCVDADDELDPEYVSLPVEVMTADETIDYTVCGHTSYNTDTESDHYGNTDINLYKQPKLSAWNALLLSELPLMVWSYMVKREYADRIKIAEKIPDSKTGCHEPGFTLPIIVGEGKSFFFERPLYRFVHYKESHSYSKDYVQIKAFYEEYVKNARTVLDEKKANEFETFLYYRAFRLAAFDDKKIEFCGDLLQKSITAVKKAYGYTVGYEKAKNDLYTFEQMFIELRNGTLKPWHSGRIIGWGALGKRGRRFIPEIKAAGIAFDLLWDTAANTDDFDGLPVTAPDISVLTADDNVIVFPAAHDEILTLLSDVGCNVFSSNLEINKLLFYRSLV
jgi:glycosyltransferase involved in cell wall biosynthesis